MSQVLHTVWCYTVFLVRLQEKFENDHSWGWRDNNRPFHGFRPPSCWVGKEIKERLPSPIQILLKSAHGAESTVRFRRFLQFYVSKRYRSLEPIEVSVFSSRLVNISSIRGKLSSCERKRRILTRVHMQAVMVAIKTKEPRVLRTAS